MIKQDFKKRPLSWSAISSFEYDHEQWYRKYVLGEINPPTKEMEFGSKIGKMLETDLTFLPMIPRHSRMEYPFKDVKLGKIPLIGFADTFCDIHYKNLGEFKTGKKEWDEERVDKHGQIDMYLLMNYLQNKILPEQMESVYLVWMPTQETGDFQISFVEPIEKNIKIFKTKRTTKNILDFANKIKRVYNEMEEYAKKHD